MKTHPRYLTPQVERDLKRKMVLVAGPRQVGKTTLVAGSARLDLYHHGGDSVRGPKLELKRIIGYARRLDAATAPSRPGLAPGATSARPTEDK